MKKVICVLIIAIMFLSMSACGKSEDAKAADELILSIGEVTLNSDEAISAAEKAVELLEEKDVSSLDNLETLKEAREEYNALVDAEKVSDVEKIIAAIGTVSIDSGKDIETAQKAYEELEDRLQGSVGNYSLLIAAQDEYLNAQAKVVEDAISAIGIVTLKSEDDIKNAKSLYTAIKPDIQERVSNYSDLVAAEDSLNVLKAEEIEEAINIIGTVTLESEDTIKNARLLYNKNSVPVKEKVKNYSLLVDAEEQLSNLKIEYVEELIRAIGIVDANSLGSITAAKEALDILTSVERAKVTNVDDIANAEAAYKQVLIEQAKEKLNDFIKEEDPFKESTFYYPSAAPTNGDGFYVDNRCCVMPYIGLDDKYVWIRVKYDYVGSDWVFWTKVSFLVDGEVTSKSYSYSDIVRDNGGRKVWEYYDTLADIDLLREIAQSEKTIVRFEGKNYYYDFEINSTDKEAIQQVIDVYDELVASEAYKAYL